MHLKHMLAAGLATAVLGGCAMTPDMAAPDDVFFLNNRLTVIFSNGMQCRAGRVAQNLSGEFPGCPVASRYEVKNYRQSYFGDSLTEPYADVTITKANGYSKEFKFPRSRRWRAEDSGYRGYR